MPVAQRQREGRCAAAAHARDVLAPAVLHVEVGVALLGEQLGEGEGVDGGDQGVE